MMVQKSGRSFDDRLQEAIRGYEVVKSLRHASKVMFLDQEEKMPKGGINARANAMGDVEVVIREKLLALENKIEGLEGRNDIEKGIIKEFWSEIVYAKSLPEELIREMEVKSSTTSEVWKVAKKRSNFKLVQPDLERIVEMKRSAAEHLGYNEHPYDALVDLFEHEMTVKQMDAIFDTLLPNLKRIREKANMREEHPLEQLEHSKPGMRRIARELEKMLNISSDNFRKGISEHPYTVSLDLKDVRITTGYHKRDFKQGLFDGLHELGHALYALQIDQRIKDTPAEDDASFGIDESQSRFWENIVGHSESFVRMLHPFLVKHLKITDSPEEVYSYFNLLKHDAVIRMASNELEYDLHIALRYRIEKGLIGGDIKVSELPQVWNEYMLKYIGIKPANDREGVLQDMHWYTGDFGYFPTYTIGNIVSGMIWKKIGNLDELIEQKRFDYIRLWLGENIHQYGAMYNPKKLLQNVFRKDYNADDYIEYLEQKYIR
ncbi:MAG: carboxypeptidase M32 [Candidatus Micrarchaeota archaeon]|nr:carboxypeptidase M32 [Candidatus Micrarchaeota archaeon]